MKHAGYIDTSSRQRVVFLLHVWARELKSFNRKENLILIEDLTKEIKMNWLRRYDMLNILNGGMGARNSDTFITGKHIGKEPIT
jgi:hypothetical protein